MKHVRLVFFLFSCAFFSWVSAAYEPATVYLTWQRSPDTTMTIHWITALDRKDNTVEYKRHGEIPWKETKGKQQPMPGNYPFLIHTVELTALSADTAYVFRTGNDAKEYKFRTMPAELKKPVRFIVGGDFYPDGLEILGKMNKQAASLNPMFVLCGGDLAYNDERGSAISRAMPRWMDWLIAWKNQMVTQDGYLIPLIPVIGNHDVVKKSHPPAAPFFNALFSMPGQQGYNVLDFGKYMSIVLLDSEHIHLVEEQAPWLSKTLESRKEIPHKFALYHVSAFPAVRKYDSRVRERIRKHWVPLFEKFSISSVFENNDHAYKRTNKILGGKPDPKGVTYIGDGGWGVEEPRQPKDPAWNWYLAKTAKSRSLIFVTLHENERHYIVFDDEGKILDEFVIK